MTVAPVSAKRAADAKHGVKKASKDGSAWRDVRSDRSDRAAAEPAAKGATKRVSKSATEPVSKHTAKSAFKSESKHSDKGASKGVSKHSGKSLSKHTDKGAAKISSKSTKERKDKSSESSADAAKTDAAAQNAKKTRKESRDAQRTAALERKAGKPLAQIVADMKAHWNDLRSNSATAAERRPHIEAVLRLSRGRVAVLALKSDASRVLQCVATHCTVDERKAMAAELCSPKPLDGDGPLPKQAMSLSSLSGSTAAIHLIAKLVRDCAASRAAMVAGGISGRVVRLLSRKEGLALLDLVYDELAPAARLRLLLEAYVPSTGVLADSLALPPSASTVHDVIAAAPTKRDVVIESLRRVTDAFIARERLSSHVAQRLLNDRLSLEPSALVAPAIAPITASADALRVLTSSAEGCEVLVRVVAASAARERRTLVKALKGHVADMLADTQQAQVVMAALVLVDDTVLLGRTLVPEVIAAFRSALASSEVLPRGVVRTVLALIAGCDARHVTNQFAALLAALPSTSQKPADVRRSEVFAVAESDLGAVLASEATVRRLFSDIHALHIAVEFAALVPDSPAAKSLSALVAEAVAPSILAVLRANDAKARAAPAAVLVRAMVQRHHALASVIVDLMDGCDGVFADETTAAYVLVSCMRHAELASRIASFADAARASDTSAARFFLSRLSQ